MPAADDTWLSPWPQPKPIRVPVASPWISVHEMALVQQALEAQWVGPQGPDLRAATNKLSHAFGGRATTLVSNGTVALELVLRAMNIGHGDEVLVPALTYAATANAVVAVGARPVFCDVRKDNWALDAGSVARMITPRSKAVIVAHLYGAAAPLEDLSRLLQEEGLALIEDCAEALLGTAASGMAGSLGLASTWSFFANKLLTSGEGGAISTSDPDLMQRIELLKGQGMSPNRRYFFTEPGGNYRMSNIQAAVLSGQLDRISEIWIQRTRIEDAYHEALSGYMTRPTVTEGGVRSPWLYTAKLRSHVESMRGALAGHLASRGIETRPVFYPLPFMPAYASFSADCIPNAIAIAKSGISLPTGVHVAPEIQQEIIGEVANLLEGYERDAVD